MTRRAIAIPGDALTEGFRGDRERKEAIRFARAVIFGLTLSPLTWVLLIAGGQQILAIMNS